jgi:predicted nucleotidyltransferase component of viral defense system
MPFRDAYRRQVALLLRVIPFVAEEECFALKGGSAINRFIRNLPRLSVDIDLTYLPVVPRDESLSAIDAAMRRIANRIAQTLASAQIVRTALRPERAIVKLLVRRDGAQVKIEVTPVLRGCVFAAERRSVSPAVEESYGFAEMQVVSFADLYAGKMVAALDRQHPRDLFDVRDLLAREGLPDALRRAFVVYLISHNRPIAEVLAPQRKPLEGEFLRGFEGMTDSAVRLQDLEEAREKLIADAVEQMPEPHRRFLLSFKRGEPRWEFLGVPGVERLPAVQWRILNLNQLTRQERERFVGNLESVLYPA